MIKLIRDNLYAVLAGFLCGVCIVAALFTPHTAHAATFSSARSFSSVRVYSAPRVYAAPRVYVAPRPIYMAPRPRVYIAPRPVYVAPAPMLLPSAAPTVDVPAYGQPAPVVDVYPVHSTAPSYFLVFLLILFLLALLSGGGYWFWCYDPFDWWIDDYDVVVY